MVEPRPECSAEKERSNAIGICPRVRADPAKAAARDWLPQPHHSVA